MDIEFKGKCQISDFRRKITQINCY